MPAPAFDEPIARFLESYIPEPNSGCWLWLGNLDKNGYGVLTCRGHYRATHLALASAGRPRPSPRLNALHRCDNPGCVNPEHLYWGTQSDNNNDAVRRGRWGDRKPEAKKGTEHYLARLTPETVRECRRLVRSGMSHRLVGCVFGVSAGTVGDVMRGMTWKHVSD